MTAPQAETIFEDLFQKVSELTDRDGGYLSKNDLYVRSLYRDAEKLKKANRVHGEVIQGMLAAGCGQIDEAVECFNLALKLSHEYHMHANLLFTMGARFLLPSITIQHLDRLTGEPHAFFDEGTLVRALALGAYEHVLAAAATLERVMGDNAKGGGVIDAVRAVASKMEKSGIQQAKSTRIVECAGKVLKRHNLRHLGSTPEYTTQDREVGMWIKLPVTPGRAAELELELINDLIAEGLDVEPFFVSFIGMEDVA
mgnify:FL=1